MNDALVAFAIFIGLVAIAAPVILYFLWKQSKKGDAHT